MIGSLKGNNDSLSSPLSDEWGNNANSPRNQLLPNNNEDKSTNANNLEHGVKSGIMMSLSMEDGPLQERPKVPDHTSSAAANASHDHFLSPSPNSNSNRKLIERYPSIDFLRGIAIVVMLVLHIVGDTLDIDSYIAKLDAIPAINIYYLLVMPFFGGLAGLFLMVSAIGNMIGMVKNATKNHHSPLAIAKKQMVGGGIMIAMAMISEGLLGYHGGWGDVCRNLNRLGDVFAGNYEFNSWRTNAYHFETLHAIAWSAFLNGLVHGIISHRVLSENNHFYDHEKMIRIYWVLVGCTLAITPVLWYAVSVIIPGYPLEINPDTNLPIYLPYVGVSPWYDYILYFFVNPIAAPVEPVFPYLATSFIGSIIGLHMTNNDKFDKSFVTRYLSIATTVFFLSFAVLILQLVHLNDFDAALSLYQQIYNARIYTASISNLPFGWLFQYLVLNGFAVMCVMSCLRLHEYRGCGTCAAKFARATTSIRRFGFVAFSVYILQWIYCLVFFGVSAIYRDTEFYGRLPWSGTVLCIVITFGVFHCLLCVWEGYGYVGSLEWFLLSLANSLMPSVKKSVGAAVEGSNAKWWQRGKLNVAGVFYCPNWMVFPRQKQQAIGSGAGEDETQRRRREQERKEWVREEIILIKYMSYVGFLIPPFSYVAYRLVVNEEREQLYYSNVIENEHDVLESLRYYKRVSIVAMVFFLGWFLLLNVTSLNTFGVYF